MKIRITAQRAVVWSFAALCASTTFSAAAQEGEGGRRIEEVVVTAERRESTVSDTSISITAFTGEMLEDFGIRNQEDLQNYIPAAVIEPYDMAIRGVGRNFRALGGDPGIATYLNGVYSEDFGIASTEGGLFDIERIEVLRGPQGTLYGRNAIGGAVNFINKKPTNEFEGEARAVAGNEGLIEYYGMLSGPIIKDVLSARATGVKRERDGYFRDLGPADDAGNYGDENYALSLRWTPNDTMEFNIRGNERSYRRRMGGANAAGIVVFGENDSQVRDTDQYALGYRAVDPAVPCPDMFTRTATVPTEGVRGGTGCAVAGMPTFSFTNPTTGDEVIAQRLVSGFDSSGVGTQDNPNRLYNGGDTLAPVLGFDNLEGDDLVTQTSGSQDEYFDHQAVSADFEWEINDWLATKWIFGYTDYFYDRTSDMDLSNNPSFDRQFYVSQETEYISNELQFFLDPTDDLSITLGGFIYNAKINQRGDYYDSTCDDGAPCLSRYGNDFAGGPILGIPKMDLFTAREATVRNDVDGTPLPGNCLLLADPAFTYCFGDWAADEGDSIPHGPETYATDTEYQTRTDRDAYAVYGQGTYTFNEYFALTLGLRWARDELDAYETAFYYTESEIVPLGFDPAGGASSLGATNVALGYVDGTTGEILNQDLALTTGLPTSTSLYRELDRDDDEITWRVNFDWTPTDDDLIYISATKGTRGGGFNLGNFSANATYDGEELIAYELGYKGTQFDDSVQLNAALYYYDYEDIHTPGSGPSLTDPNNPSVSTFAVPEAYMIGLDADFVWLATDRITLGGNFSYTKSEYDSDFTLIDNFDPSAPNSLFVATANGINIDGNQMQRIPEYKGGAWGQYAWPLGARGSVELFTSWTWIDKVYFSPFEDERDSADSYSRWDARATWRSPDESWTVAAFINNILDEVGIRQIDRSAESFNYLRAGVTTDPQLYGLEVRYKFNSFP